jgi:DNA-binding SARP family transcriptional activator
MTELSLALLGSPVVQRNGIPVTFDTRKATALLALLAVTGREHSRKQLVDLLWPEADSAKGRASLRRTLSVTAAVMGPCLTISRTAVSLETDQVRVDVREFSRLIARADAASLEQAVQLYRRPLNGGGEPARWPGSCTRTPRPTSAWAARWP